LVTLLLVTNLAPGPATEKPIVRGAELIKRKEVGSDVGVADAIPAIRSEIACYWTDWTLPLVAGIANA
jgi:hypothetical protein